MHPLFQQPVKRCTFSFAIVVLLSALLCLLTACATTPKVQKTTSVDYRAGVPGGTMVETYQLNVTVASIDAATRKLTLVAPDSSRNTFTAPPGDRAFDRLKPGDQIQINVTRQLVVFLRKNGAPLNENPAINTALAPESAESGIARSDTVERVAKVGSIDRKRRQATLDFPDGTAKTFAVRKDVELDQIKPGEEVVIRTTSAVALAPDSP